MKILMATYEGVPGYSRLHIYMEKLKAGLEGNGHQVDTLSHEPWMTLLYLNGNLSTSVLKEKIRGPLAREVFAFYKNHYKEIESWVIWRDIERYTFELCSAYLIDSFEKYDIVHAQDLFSARALSRIMPENIPLVTTIHSVMTQDLENKKQIWGEETARWKYVSLEEYFGIISSDVVMCPQGIKDEYERKFNLGEQPMISIRYDLDNEKELTHETINVYQSCLQR